MEWWQEYPIEGTVGVRAVTGVEKLKDAFLASLKITSALDLKLLEWKYHLKSLGAGALIKVTYIHYSCVSRVETWITERSICTLNGKITRSHHV